MVECCHKNPDFETDLLDTEMCQGGSLTEDQTELKKRKCQRKNKFDNTNTF